MPNPDRMRCHPSSKGLKDITRTGARAENSVMPKNALVDLDSNVCESANVWSTASRIAWTEIAGGGS
jgi:hypothetical protein